MPYVYAQAKDCSEHGLPMVRALFIEYPDDPGAWLVDDEYLFGSSILVAPLMHENATGRDVYLPPGTWIDYQGGKSYDGGWHHIEAGQLPVVMLVRNGTVIPQIALAAIHPANGLVETSTHGVCQRSANSQRSGLSALR